MTHSLSITPRPGFDWSAVNWGGPDEPRTEHCSYCGDKLPEDDDFMPLILWNADGWAAEFCDHCQATWWGLESFDESSQPQHEPEVFKKRM